MYVSPDRPVLFDTKLAWQFPTAPCCNCGSLAGLSVQVQETKVTRYFLFFGTELTFNFPVPVCALCAPTLKRKPATLFHKLLMSLLLSVVLLLIAVTVLAEPLSQLPFVSRHLFLSTCVLAAVLTYLFYALRRPAPRQSSYYQPVRVLKAKQEFISGTVNAMAFGFTCKAYYNAFSALNLDAISAGLVRARLL